MSDSEFEAETKTVVRLPITMPMITITVSISISEKPRSPRSRRRTRRKLISVPADLGEGGAGDRLAPGADAPLPLDLLVDARSGSASAWAPCHQPNLAPVTIQACW